MPIPIITNFEPQGSGYVVDNQHVKGSVRSVATAADRLNIPIQNRSLGMLVHEQDTDFEYRLVTGLDNDSWVQQPISFAYSHEVAGTEEIITHNLGKYPAVTVIDTSGNMVWHHLTYDDNTTVTLRFNSFVRGDAFFA